MRKFLSLPNLHKKSWMVSIMYVEEEAQYVRDQKCNALISHHDLVLLLHNIIYHQLDRNWWKRLSRQISELK